MKGIAMDKKTLQKRRIMSYFIKAAEEIMDADGIEAVTIRSVADKAGYNSATLYNYFDNIDHLIYYASIKHLKAYAEELPDQVKGSKNALDRFFKIWECFCRHAYTNPKIYHLLFFNTFGENLKGTLEEYYRIFPEELAAQEVDTLEMLQKKDIFERNKAILKGCMDEGFFLRENLDEINEMVLLIFQGMLERLVRGLSDLSPEEATRKTLRYIRQALKSYNDCHLVANRS